MFFNISLVASKDLRNGQSRLAANEAVALPHSSDFEMMAQAAVLMNAFSDGTTIDPGGALSDSKNAGVLGSGAVLHFIKNTNGPCTPAVLPVL